MGQLRGQVQKNLQKKSGERKLPISKGKLSGNDAAQKTASPKKGLLYPVNSPSNTNVFKEELSSAPPITKALPKRKKQVAYNDIDLDQWRNYEDVETGSLWLYGSRDKSNGHELNYHGNCIPQIVTQLLKRYTKNGDVILDLFLGSGTSAIEATHLGRKAIGVELQDWLVKAVQQRLIDLGKAEEVRVIEGDSSHFSKTKPKIKQALKGFDKESAQFLFLHPPYDDIIRFSTNEQDLSNQTSTEDFLEGFEKVATLGYAALEPGRFAAVVIGDKYTNGEWLPLGFWCMERMNAAGFKTKSIVVKNMTGNEKGKGKTANLWRYRALAGGFYLFQHEYIFIFQKPAK